MKFKSKAYGIFFIFYGFVILFALVCITGLKMVLNQKILWPKLSCFFSVLEDKLNLVCNFCGSKAY